MLRRGGRPLPKKTAVEAVGMEVEAVLAVPVGLERAKTVEEDKAGEEGLANANFFFVLLEKRNGIIQSA
jgi:hypothetical protein